MDFEAEMRRLKEMVLTRHPEVITINKALPQHPRTVPLLLRKRGYLPCYRTVTGMSYTTERLARLALEDSLIPVNDGVSHSSVRRSGSGRPKGGSKAARLQQIEDAIALVTAPQGRRRKAKTGEAS